MRVLKVLGIVGVIFNMIYAQNLNLSGRNYFCLSLGMGVNYVNVPDVVDYVRSISGERLKDFDGALELWLAPEFKIGRNIAVKFEYSYISKNYEVWKSDWRYLFDYELRNQVLIIDYLHFQKQEIFILKIGAGIGLVNARFVQHLPMSGKDVLYKSNGGIFKIEGVFSSRLDWRVFVYLSTDLKFGLTGELKDDDGNVLIIRKPFGEDRNLRLNFIGVSFRAGFSVYI